MTRPNHVEFPKIVCLCGSTKYVDEFQRAGAAETLAGNIVLSIGVWGPRNGRGGNITQAEYESHKGHLDQLHFRKIEMADEILFLNVGGYIGESTTRELEYARQLGKAIRFQFGPNGEPGLGQTEPAREQESQPQNTRKFRKITIP